MCVEIGDMMKDIIKNLVKIVFPVFNAYVCMFGFIGIYAYSGGKLSDKLGWLFVPIIISMVYGAYIGHKAIENLK